MRTISTISQKMKLKIGMVIRLGMIFINLLLLPLRLLWFLFISLIAVLFMWYLYRTLTPEQLDRLENLEE